MMGRIVGRIWNAHHTTMAWAMLALALVFLTLVLLFDVGVPALTVIEYYALVLTLICAGLIWRIFAVTKAKAMFMLGAGYLWWCALKFGLVLKVGFFVTYSRVLSGGIGLLMVVGLWLFLRVLRKNYNGNGKT
jgi:hypothetical protein